MHTRFRFRGRTRVGIGETDFNVGLVYTYTRVYMCACVCVYFWNTLVWLDFDINCAGARGTCQREFGSSLIDLLTLWIW